MAKRYNYDPVAVWESMTHEQRAGKRLVSKSKRDPKSGKISTKDYILVGKDWGEQC